MLWCSERVVGKGSQAGLRVGKKEMVVGGGGGGGGGRERSERWGWVEALWVCTGYSVRITLLSMRLSSILHVARFPGLISMLISPNHLRICTGESVETVCVCVCVCFICHIPAL